MFASFNRNLFFPSLDFFSDLSNVMNSTPNIKAVNGKAESSDSGAESEEEGLREEEEKELQLNGSGMFSALGQLFLSKLFLTTWQKIPKDRECCTSSGELNANTHRCVCEEWQCLYLGYKIEN